jgi:hypothetical protein
MKTKKNLSGWLRFEPETSKVRIRHSVDNALLVNPPLRHAQSGVNNRLYKVESWVR